MPEAREANAPPLSLLLPSVRYDIGDSHFDTATSSPMFDPISRIDVGVATQALDSFVVHLRPRTEVFLLREVLLEGERRICVVSEPERVELALG